MIKRLVLFVEGDGDKDAVPTLIKRLLTERNAWDCLSLDPNPFVVGQANGLFKNDYRNWRRWLGAAAKRDNIGAVTAGSGWRHPQGPGGNILPCSNGPETYP